MPCKAKVFADLDAITVRRCITILKQILLRYGYILAAQERSEKGRKICQYRVLHASKIPMLTRMIKTVQPITVEF